MTSSLFHEIQGIGTFRERRIGIIEPVQYVEWAAPVIPILKADGKLLRIC